MKIVDLMSPELVIPSLDASSRDEVIAALVDCIVRSSPAVDRENAIRVLVERERIGSTGVGDGLAIPHAKLHKLPRPVACFARCPKGVDFGSIDKRPTHLFLALLAPEGSAGYHLMALARASRLFKDAGFRARLMELDDREQLWSAIYERDVALTQKAGA